MDENAHLGLRCNWNLDDRPGITQQLLPIGSGDDHVGACSRMFVRLNFAIGILERDSNVYDPAYSA